MPIVYVHGVAVRDKEEWPALEKFLRRYIAPEISDQPEAVKIIPAWWFEHAAKFWWGTAAIPDSPILGLGTEAETTDIAKAVAAADLTEALEGAPRAVRENTSGLLSSGPREGSIVSGHGLRLKELSRDELSDLAATSIARVVREPAEQALAAIAADEVAYDDLTFAKLAAAPDAEHELQVLEDLLYTRYRILHVPDLKAAGGVSGWLGEFGRHVGEALDRGADVPGFIASRVLVELRRPLNRFIAIFLGDVFTYLRNRKVDGKPGPIAAAVLQALAEARESQKQKEGEPLIVLTHSMGGQILYDAVTHFLPALPEYRDIHIHFWCATASQVGLFEELKLFEASSVEYGADTMPVPFASQHLGVWWNVWDPSDILSYTARGIIDGLIDDSYNSGMSLLGAHSGYLKRPSFYRRFRQVLREAKARAWR